MSTYPQLKIRHSPLTTYSGNTQQVVVGAQTVAGMRGTLPTFTDANSYFLAKTGADTNAGASATPKLTLGSLFSTAASYTEISGTGYNLNMTGTVPLSNYPCAPLPPLGESAYAGPFTDSNYFTGSTNIKAGLNGDDAFTMQGWLFLENETAGHYNTIFEFKDNTPKYVVGRTIGTGAIELYVDGTVATSAAGLVVAGVWYYFAFTFNSGATDGVKVYLGSSPETLTVVATATKTYTIGTLSDIYVGRDVASASREFRGYLGRVTFHDAVKTTFPGKISDFGFGIVSMTCFRTRCLMETAPLAYIVVQDSGKYYEGLYAPWKYDLTSSFGVYAADGQAPTFGFSRGAIEGTYGAGNAARVVWGAATPNCYVNQTTGNDATGARGNASKPFKTIQAALTAMTSNADIVEVQDSVVYSETLTWPALLDGTVLRAKAGEVPVLRPARYDSTTVHLIAGHNGALTIDGFILDGIGDSATLSGGYSGALPNFRSCSVRNYASFIGTGMNTRVYNCTVNRVATVSAGSSALSVFNTFFDNPMAGSARVPVTLGIQNCNLSQCSFKNSTITFHGNANTTTWDQCDFQNCAVKITDGAPVCRYILTNCSFPLSTFKAEISDTGFNYRLLLLNCQQHSSGEAAGFEALQAYSGKMSVWMVSCSAAGNVRNFYLHGTHTTSCLRNCSSALGTTAGFDAPSTVIGDALVDGGSVVAWQSGIVPSPSESSANFLDASSAAALNISLSASDNGIFGAGGVELRDMGQDFRAWNVSVPVLTVNGLIFTGAKNGEAAIGTSNNTRIITAFCTFDGLGTYAMTMGDGSSVANCFFETNGHAVKFARATTTIQHCIGSSCGGAFLVNFGQYSYISNNTAYGCQYGQYDVTQGAVGKVIDNIYSGSGAFDYSGPAVLSYCCVGTIDPNSTGTVDIYCIRLDPLFEDASANTVEGLQLQSTFDGYFYNSPCLNASSTGNDIGALDWNFGSSSTAWTEINFATAGYRNPDVVLRRIIPIKLAEGEQEDGAVYSIAAAFKKEYELSWSESESDMPEAQLLALYAMFTSAVNNLEVDFGLGMGYVPHFLARAQGFEYSEMTGGYADTTTPQPLRSCVIREA